MMRTFLLTAGLLAASFVPASAESVTADVANWDPATRTVTLEDLSQFVAIPAAKIPAEMNAGVNVTIDYEATDNGVASYNSIQINSDIAKRLLPPNKG